MIIIVPLCTSHTSCGFRSDTGKGVCQDAALQQLIPHARLDKADCAISFSARVGTGLPHLSQAMEGRQLSSVDPDSAEGMIRLTEAEGIAL